MSTFRSLCPVVGETDQEFFKNVKLGSSVHSKRVNFTEHLYWLLMSETQLLFRHGGKLLKEGTTYSDYYGYLSSLEGCRQQDIADLYQITRKSSLELLLMTTVYLQPAIQTEEDARINTGSSTGDSDQFSQFSYIPSNWLFIKIDSGDRALQGARRKVLEQFTVWSSKNSAEENSRIMAQFNEDMGLRAIPNFIHPDLFELV